MDQNLYPKQENKQRDSALQIPEFKYRARSSIPGATLYGISSANHPENGTLFVNLSIELDLKRHGCEQEGLRKRESGQVKFL